MKLTYRSKAESLFATTNRLMRTVNEESGHILLLVLVFICIITFITISLANQTTSASFFAVRRAGTVRSFSLAESAALEGYWNLCSNPAYRGSQSRYWGTEWYQFFIIDSTPDTTDDLYLEILGQGNADGKLRGVRLKVNRADVNSTFQIVSWSEEN